MSARRVSEKASIISQNAHFLEFERSDGDSRNWPTNTTRVIDEEGHVNFMQPLDLDHPGAIRWRISIAQGIAAAMNLPAGHEYVLKSWPEGYAFYNHHKGNADNPRNDLYLFGRDKVRYRSVNEFIPHAIWLMQDHNMNVSNCLCKYCQKVPQKEVTASLPPGILRQTHHGTQSPSPSRPPRERTRNLRETVLKSQRDSKVYVAVRKAPLPTLAKSPSVHHKYTMLVERNSDLRAVHSKADMRLKRWFRVGELLWCALNPPIKGTGDNVAISFWPALVDEVKLKTKPIPHSTPLAYPNASTDIRSVKEGKDKDIVIDDPSDPIPWNIRQSTEYRVQLLAVNHSFLVADDQVLPYQAHIPPNELIVELQAFPPERLDFDREALANFNPCPKEGTPKFEEAVAPYAMAVQIGSTLSGYWCLTDEWAFEYSTPLPESAATPSNSTSVGATSLQAAIEAASLHNSHPHISSPDTPLPSLHHYQDISRPSSGIPTSELQRHSARMIGKPMSSAQSGPPLKQIRFQGLWWGAERVWTDDFVRLKVPRRSIAPKGAENILPPSGPGKSAREIWTKKGRDPAEIGAGTRGIFMRLDGLFVVDAIQEDGVTKKECRASGMLYELADADWDDPGTSKDYNMESVDTRSSSTQPTSFMNTSPPAPMTFVPAPSPLNPHVLPQTAPPLASVSSTNRLQTSQSSTSNLPLPNAQLSHPSPPHYLLPQAPEGYVFRPLLPDGHEAVISLSLISGRYYPRILSHPLLETIMKDALNNPLERGGLLESNNLWALEGLSAGFYNSVDPTQYKTSRTKMVEDADKAAGKQLEIHTQERVKERKGNVNNDELQLAYPEAMDLDD